MMSSVTVNVGPSFLTFGYFSTKINGSIIIPTLYSRLFVTVNDVKVLTPGVQFIIGVPAVTPRGTRYNIDVTKQDCGFC